MRTKVCALILSVMFLFGCTAEKQASAPVVPKTSEQLFQEAMTFLAQNKIPEAIQSLEQSAEASPESVNAYFALAQLYMRLESYDNAIITCQKILQKEQKNPHVYLLMAGCYDLKGEPEKAVELVKVSMALFQEQNNVQGFQDAAGILKKLLEEE
ncbi:MAG: tetratricopeptide repeat protein [Candidatus Omnitrophica bacterium]|nr:tetratricopeptide repeat protein [Candidatus Omnitrophota bacterium]